MLNSDGDKLKWHTFALRENEPCDKYFLVLYINRYGAPRYKPDGHGFDYRWCHWNFSLTLFLRSPSVTGIFPGGKGRSVRGADNSTAFMCRLYVCMEIWEPQPPGTVRACPGFYTSRCTRKRFMILFFTDRIRGYCRCSVDGSLTCTNTYLSYKNFPLNSHRAVPISITLYCSEWWHNYMTIDVRVKKELKLKYVNFKTLGWYT